MDSNNLSDKLVAMKREGEEREAQRLAESLSLPYLDLSAIPLDQDALLAVPEEKARLAKAAPIKLKQKELTIAFADPALQTSKELKTNLENKGLVIQAVVSSFSGITQYWNNYVKVPHEQAREIVSRLDITEDKIDQFKATARNIEGAVKLFDSVLSAKTTTEILELIIGTALSTDSSDIHCETNKDGALVRFRVDGLLHDIHRFSSENYRQILNRIKLLSGLKINTTDVPQDGRFTIHAGTLEIEIRVSIIPSEFGEAIVMRVLNPKAISLSLPDLGLRPDDADLAEREIKRPNGMILVTGPTGSGKTTTLYAFLKKVADPELKIITIEDPIEYHLTGIEQAQVDPKSGYTFASGLRSILRQDPDMILVGEIRDAETAEIAVHASLTGHLVFSTLHTNNAVGAIPRLVDIGIKPTIIGPSITLVIAQRLVRRLCPYCKVEKSIDAELKAKLDTFMAALPKKVKPYTTDIKTYEAKGCDKCSGGYKGRLGIFEFLPLGGEYEALINKDATEFAIKTLAKSKGFVEMQADGVLKAIAGMTTFDEVEKVTGPIEW